MSPSTYFIKPFHVYTLRVLLAPNSPVKHVLVLTNPDLANHPRLDFVTALPLTFSDASRESLIRVRLQCVGSGGTARLPADAFTTIDKLFALPKNLLFEQSGTEIAEDEKRMVREKLLNWLGI